MGIISAIAEIGPKPGSMPMKVPAKQPTITIRRLVGVIAVDSPVRIPSIMILVRSRLNSNHDFNPSQVTKGSSM